MVLARRPLHGAVGDLRDLELPLHGRLDAPQLALLLEQGDELAQILEAHRAAQSSQARGWRRLDPGAAQRWDPFASGRDRVGPVANG